MAMELIRRSATLAPCFCTMMSLRNERTSSPIQFQSAFKLIRPGTGAFQCEDPACQPLEIVASESNELHSRNKYVTRPVPEAFISKTSSFSLASASCRTRVVELAERAHEPLVFKSRRSSPEFQE